jgi:hypothetical protein
MLRPFRNPGLDLSIRERGAINMGTAIRIMGM